LQSPVSAKISKTLGCQPVDDQAIAESTAAPDLIAQQRNVHRFLSPNGISYNGE